MYLISCENGLKLTVNKLGNITAVIVLKKCLLKEDAYSLYECAHRCRYIHVVQWNG